MRMRMLISSIALTITTAIPTVALSASPADAAPLRTWERLAHCESGGNWRINTGNGYYGGLQISGRTWAGFGGRQFAILPHRATKPQQIRVAERILRGQGWGAWGSCASRLGLG